MGTKNFPVNRPGGQDRKFASDKISVSEYTDLYTAIIRQLFQGDQKVDGSSGGNKYVVFDVDNGGK